MRAPLKLPSRGRRGSADGAGQTGQQGGREERGRRTDPGQGWHSPVVHLQEGEVCLGCDLPLLVLRGIRVLEGVGGRRLIWGQ